jgi:hypothetical protein
VVSRAWRALDDELERWREAGRAVEFWWRDDDAAAPNAALERLVSLAQRARVPLALAVVPQWADPQLLAGLDPGVAVLQHGADHRNRAAQGDKKNEFPASEPVSEAVARLVAARERLSALAGTRWIPVLAPPWNRLQPGLLPHLPRAGFRGLSRYGARTGAAAVPGLRQVNAHVDIVDWGGTRGFAGEEQALARAVAHLEAKRTGKADAAEPTGWLTHHARHDEPAWTFLERLFEITRGESGVRWRSAVEFFTEPGPG